MKKVLTAIGTTLILIAMLAMPVAATPLPSGDGIPFQPYWEIANEAYLEFSVGGGSAKANFFYELPSGASAQCTVKIEEKAPGGNWGNSVSSSTAVSRPTKGGYQYKASGTLTITTRGGEREVISFNKGPLTA